MRVGGDWGMRGSGIVVMMVMSRGTVLNEGFGVMVVEKGLVTDMRL